MWCTRVERCSSTKRSEREGEGGREGELTVNTVKEDRERERERERVCVCAQTRPPSILPSSTPLDPSPLLEQSPFPTSSPPLPYNPDASPRFAGCHPSFFSSHLLAPSHPPPHPRTRPNPLFSGAPPRSETGVVSRFGCADAAVCCAARVHKVRKRERGIEWQRRERERRENGVEGVGVGREGKRGEGGVR